MAIDHSDTMTRGQMAIQERIAREKEAFIETYAACMGIAVMACKKAGITRSTLYNWRRSDPVFNAALLEADEGVIDRVEGKLLQKINDGDRQCIIFYLKTKAKHRGYTEKVEHIVNGTPVSDGDYIRIDDIKQDIPPDALEKVLKELAAMNNTDGKLRFPNRDDDRGAKPFAERIGATVFARSDIQKRSAIPIDAGED